MQASIPLLAVALAWGMAPAALAQGALGAPSVAAPAALGPVERLRTDLYEWGMVLVAEKTTQEGRATVLEGARLAPRPDTGGNWGLALGQVRIETDAKGWTTVRVGGPVVWTLAGVDTLGLKGSGITARLGPQAADGSLAGWGIEAAEVRASLRDTTGQVWQVSGEGFAYTGDEADRAFARHSLSMDALVVGFPAGARVGDSVRVEGMDAELRLQSGGYLENLPWMAAIASGMAAEGEASWRRAAWEGATAGPAAAFVRAGRGEVSARQSGAHIKSEWMAEDLAVRRPGFEITKGAVKGALDLPVMVAAEPAPLRLEGTVGGEMRAGATTWALAGDLSLSGAARMARPWYVYAPDTHTGRWDSFWSVFSPTQLNVERLSVLVDGAGLNAAGSAAVPEGGPTGALTVASTGTLPLLEWVEGTGVVAEDVARSIRGLLGDLFGSDAGAAPQEVRVDVRPEGMFVGETRLWPPRY